ncbi:HAD family hydrolase [Methanoregula sp.]|jgi:phosphoglycolate phosphatase-like HAD superfamily hydrolase|uniref:HAD family hydrolase n=1 Tax=Methanoregula sp. TaxID=2052170 RepID=UPI003C2614A1
MIDTVILDFDGVILESVSVKTDAFRSLFSFVPDHVDEIIEYHLSHGGVSRFDKFRFIYHDLLKKDLSEEQFNFLSEEFAKLVYNGVLTSPYVNGAMPFLEKNHQRFHLFVVSATPEEELISIIRTRGIAHYLQGVYGAPRKKEDCIRHILSERGITSDSALFVGDSPNDLEAAQKTGVHFIGRVRPGDTDRFSGKPGIERVIGDLSGLADCIEGVVR